MKNKTADLNGAALAQAVALALGWLVYPDGGGDGALMVCEVPEGDVYSFGEYGFRPDRDWETGGPIIERERITIVASEYGGQMEWSATVGPFTHYIDESLPLGEATGPTPLVAAMRAYVASKLGQEVELL